jgi:molybdenum cofactor cytidylyltransferase
VAGHPVLFPADLRAELLALQGDEGARMVLQRHKARLRLIALPNQHALTDLDTPEAWAAWRLRQR